MNISMHILFLFSAAFPLTSGGQSEAVTNYIDTYKWIAVEQMQAYGIPASITLAQGILESGAGMSELAKESNNHFGIKCHDSWKGDKVYYDDDAEDECFRKYKNPEDSYVDHSLFLSAQKRYADLFELDITDYKAWAKGLKSAGYATNPKYAELLIDLIEKYELYAYDDKASLAGLKKEKHKSNTSDTKKSSKKTTEEKNKKEDEHFSWNGYNANVFYFNRIPTVTLKQGDTPESLAQEHHIKVSNLLKYNNLTKGETIEAGKNFYLQPKRKKGKTKYHEVLPGETMASISRDEGILLEALYEKNKIAVGDEPEAGEKLYLRSTRKTAPQTQKSKAAEKEMKAAKNDFIIVEENFEEENPVAELVIKPVEQTTETITASEDSTKPEIQTENISQPVYHTVQAQETLYALSKKYKVKVEEIQAWNNLSGSGIKIGQKLIVGYSAR